MNGTQQGCGVGSGRSIELTERGSGLLWASEPGAQLWDGARVLADYISDPSAPPLHGDLKVRSRVLTLSSSSTVYPNSILKPWTLHALNAVNPEF